jgi:hypothetical protein
MEEKAGDFRCGESLVRFSCIWRCQNRYDGSENLGKYCKKVSGWIICTWNGEIPSIFRLPLGFSIAKAGAAAKMGNFVEEL